VTSDFLKYLKVYFVIRKTILGLREAYWTRNRLVSIVIGYKLENVNGYHPMHDRNPRKRGLIPSGGKPFIFLPNVQTNSGVDPSTY
jgi:hypothetical protein